MFYLANGFVFNQEPAFQELILLFTEERDEGETEDTAEVPLLQLKIYERIPIPDLPVNTYAQCMSMTLFFQILFSSNVN